MRARLQRKRVSQSSFIKKETFKKPLRGLNDDDIEVRSTEGKLRVGI